MTIGYSFIINVPVRNEWGNVSLLVTSVQNCFNAMFSNVDGSHTIAMVTGELLENAIKYGEWAGDRNVFRLNVGGEESVARIVVENPLGNDDGRELLRTLEWINSFPSAAEAYRAKILEVATQPAAGGVSGLGLVRIAYEANCKLSAAVEGGTARVTAEMALQI